jgi:hypothetical protein
MTVDFLMGERGRVSAGKIKAQVRFARYSHIIENPSVSSFH